MSSKTVAMNIAVVDLNELAEQDGLTIGFEIPPNTQVKIVGIASASAAGGEDDDDDDENNKEDDDSQVTFQIKSACLGAKAKQGERAVLAFGDNKTVCAALSVGVAENVALDLHFEGDFSLTNFNAANTSIHIVGRLVEEVEEEDYAQQQQQQQQRGGFPVGEDEDDDDSDDSEAQEDGFFFGGMGGDSDDDENSEDEDDEDDDEDEDAGVSRVSIQQLQSSDDEEEQEEEEEEEEQQPAVKKQKMTPKEGLQFAVPAAVKKAQAAAAAQAAAKPTTKEDVVEFVLDELKAAGGKAKASDLGASLAKRFGKPFKQLGFAAEHKTLGKLVQQEAKGKVQVKGDVFEAL